MFVFQVEDSCVVLKSILEGEKDQNCSILCSKSYNQFSRIQTVHALQTFFNIDKKEHVVEPEPEYISFHEFLAFIFQNVCSLPSTPRTEAFLDSLINLSASILNRRRNFNSLEVLKPHAESIYHLKSYKMLLDSIMNLEATSRTCTQCKEVLTSLVDLRTHMIIFHLGSDNWKLLQPGVAKELRCAPCSQQFYSVFVYFLHLNLCIGSQDLEKTAYIQRMREMKTLNLSNSNFCHVCMITLPCRENFLKHLQVHDDGFDKDPNNLICRNPKCEKDAVSISSREARMYILVKSINSYSVYTCKECGIKKLKGSAYIHHLKTQHIGLDVWSRLDPGFIASSCPNCKTLYTCPIHQQLHKLRCPAAPVNCLPTLQPTDLQYFSLEIEDSFNKSIKIRQEILENKIKDKQHREKLEEQDHGSEKDEAADDTGVDDNYKNLNPCLENEEIEKEDKKSIPNILVNYKINLIENNENFDLSRDQNDLKLEKDRKIPKIMKSLKYHKREKVQATISSDEKEANYSDSSINTETLQETPIQSNPRLHLRRQATNKENVEVKKITQEVIGHICDLCGKSYQRKTGLKRHVLTFHKKERPFSCETCDKKFGRMDSLVKHGLTHTMEKNLICEMCSKAFNQSSNLIKHRNAMHLDTNRESYRFTCTVCTGKYYSKRELAKHIRISHEKIKDHRCVLCEGKFGGRALVRRHVKKVHHVLNPVAQIHFQKLFDILD